MTMPFSVDPDDLEALTARISGLAGFVRDELDELDRRAASLTQAGWIGPGADAYTDAHSTWAAAATDLVAHVSQIEMLTRSAHHHYTVTADMNVRMLRGSQGTSIRRLFTTPPRCARMPPGPYEAESRDYARHFPEWAGKVRWTS